MKKILVTSGMLTYMLLVNAGLASAHYAPDVTEYKHKYESVKHEKNREEKLARLALKLGLDPDELQKDINSKKTIKQILKSHGITKNQLQEVMGNKRFKARV